MTSRWCFQCGTEYPSSTETCAECGIGLVDEAPTDPDDVGSEEEEQLAYDLDDWSYESRRMLNQLLTANNLDHAWQGASLIIREADEELVDELVEQVERTTLPTLDPEKEHVAVDLEGWTPEQIGQLSERLGLTGIPHEFDVAGDLIIHSEDEESFDELVDAVSAEMAEAQDDGGLAAPTLEMEGVELNDLLTEVFVSADRLRRNTRDPEGVLGFAESGAVLVTVKAPFGIDATTWRSLRRRVDTMNEMLASEDAEDEDVLALAQQLRDELHRMI